MTAPREGFLGRLALRAWSADEIRSAGLSCQQYDLLESLVYVGKYGTTMVPAGFCTDFASIPRFAWAYMDPEDPVILMPSVIHDYLYTVSGLRPDCLVALTRQQVDDQLAFESMALCGARWDQQHVVYAAVRAGGGSHWAS